MSKSRRFNIKNELEKLYIEVPKALLYEPKYKGDKEKNIKPLSNDAKLLYGIFLDRTYLSIHTATEKNDSKFIDKNGDIFIYFVNEAIAEIMNVSVKKAIALKKELTSFGLLEEEQQGDRKANRLYLNIVETDVNNLSLYTNSFQDVVGKRKEAEKIRIQEVREKQKLKKKEKDESLGNTMNCQNDSTCTDEITVPVLTDLQYLYCKNDSKVILKDFSNTEVVSNTEDFSKPDFKKSDVDYLVIDETNIDEKTKKELTYKIQKDTSLTVDEKIKALEKINFMDENIKALVYKFIGYSIPISDAQIKMLKDMAYEVVVSSLDETAARGGNSFSYFYEVYKTKEQEEINEMLNDFVFLPNFEPRWNK